jgi:hypothetical protein
MLNVRNESDAMIKYAAYMQFMRGEQLEFAPTSSCPIWPRIFGIESWPDPIVMLVLSDFRILTTDSPEMVCN